MSVDAHVLATLVDRVRGSAAQLPADPTDPVRTRLVCIDGPAGSGKTTLATQLALELDAQVVHMDDLYEGWEAGPRGGATRCAEWIVNPLRAGSDGSYRRYDWDLGVYAEDHRVHRAPIVVIEGCGAAPRTIDQSVALIIWVEAPDAERLRRGLQRDGASMEPHWREWMLDEAAFYAENDTRHRADVRIDGWGSPQI